MILFNSFPRKYCYSEINTADNESDKQIYKKRAVQHNRQVDIRTVPIKNLNLSGQDLSKAY